MMDEQPSNESNLMENTSQQPTSDTGQEFDSSADAQEPEREITGLARRARRQGRARSADEIERAKISAALTRQINADPTIMKAVVSVALERSEGKGPAMASELQKAVAERFNVHFTLAAVRSLLQRLRRAGLLESRQEGTAYIWTEGQGRPARGPKPTRRVVKPAPRRGPAPRRKAAREEPVRIPRGKAGRPRKFRGTEAADRLIEALAMALEAAEALRDELESVADVKEQVNQILRNLR